MGEDLTRKGFLAAAAAAGVAALVPSVAMADETQAPAEASPLSELDVAAVEGAEALVGSSWAVERDAGCRIDVVKSNSGIHSMNAPGYFVFTGWDPANDWVSDMGFGFFDNTFFVRSQQIDLWVNEIKVNGSKLSTQASTVLYSNVAGGIGSIPLSASYESFDRIEVFFGRDGFQSSASFCPSSSSKLALSLTYTPIPDYHRIAMSSLFFSGKTATLADGCFSDNMSDFTEFKDLFSIYQINGYN